MTDYTRYLSAKQVLFLERDLSRKEAIEQLVHLAKQQGKIPDEKEFLLAVLEREKIVSTGIGLGVALPHAKLSSIDDFFIIMGIVAEEGIDWESLDDIPVKMIFLIGGPDDKQADYLQLLSTLTMAINQEEKRKALLSLTNPEDLVSVLGDQDG